MNEDEGTIQISLLSSFTVPNNETVNIVFEIASVDATPGTGGDYEYTGGGTFGGGTYTDTVSIAGGSADVQIPINILQDSDEELPETFTVTITSVSGNATIGANSRATVTIKDDDTAINPGDVIYRINAGGLEVAANDGGSNWEADQAAVVKGSAIAGNASQYLVDRGIDGTTVPTSDNSAFGSNAPISPSANTTNAPDALFTTERFSTLVNPNNIGYAFPVINGDYLVNLYFYELFFGTAGSRIFDVEIEDTLVLDDFDTVATFGNNSGVQSFATTVNDGVLNLEFLKAAANNPHVAAIEIIAADGQPTLSVVSLDDPNPTSVLEDGDLGVTTLLFPVGFDVPPASSVTVEYSVDINGVVTSGLAQEIVTTGENITVDIPNDNVADGAETVTVTLTGITVGGDVAALGTNITAVGTITEDDIIVDSFNGAPAVNGDFSNNNVNPDDVILNLGTNTLVSTGEFSDADYITFEVQAGQQLTAVNLSDYVGGQNGAFLGIQIGNTVPSQSDIQNAIATLDGGTVYSEDQIGTNILPLLATTTVEGAGQPTNGLTLPLGPGLYTLWFNQNQNLTESTLEFITEEIPTSTTPISIFIEAEDISNVTGYRLEGKSAASGGQMLSLIGSGGEEKGTATFAFTGPTGSYDINLGTFDESDGEASFTVQQSGVKIGETIVLDQNKTGGAGANTFTKVTRLVGSGIELINGATITITGLENGREHARFDFVEFATVGDTTPTPPLASDDAFITDEDNPISGSVLANDTSTLPLTVLEVNGSDASVDTQITLSSGALLTVSSDGTFDYDPNGAFDDLTTGEIGTETFTYLASNSQGVSEATATITINGIAPPPTGISFGQELLRSLNASDGIATGGSYASGAVGAVELSVMADVNTIQSSNFAKGSFQLTNTGDKKIAAFFIDFRDAVFGDSVVDFDGSGGDTTFKKFAVDNSGTNGSETGVFFDSNDGKVYYLPGEPPLPNNTGTGIPSSGGFRGLLLKAGNTGNGFETGETAGFSGDMDPNSIAGLLKRNRNNTVGVDVGAIGNWDIGGVSGAEIAGSRFFVRFDDGTTASGVLANNDTQAGSVGRAVQGRAEIPVDVIVNSGSGEYGNGVEPTIVVTGPAGQTVKVVLAKGLQPVTNDRNGYEKLVEDRLALSQPNFQVNNSFDFQEVIVTIGSNGTVTLPSETFDYSDTESGVQFSGDDVAPIAISAVAVDVANLPIGPVDREYLTNPTQTPVAPIATDSSGYFEASSSGSNLYFKIQIEDAAALNGGTSPNGKWNYVTAPDSQGRQTGFQGTGYYVYGSNTSTGISQVNENEILKFEIEVPQAMVGRTVFFRTRASRDGVAAGDQQNDLWVNVVPKNGTGSIEDLLVRNGTNEAEPVSGEFIKLYGGPNNGTWGYAGLVDGAPKNFTARIAFPEAGRYVLEIAGRSQGFHLDFIELFTGSLGSGAANSAFVSTGSQQVQLASEIPDQSFTGGTTDTFDMLTGTFFDPNGDPVADQASVTAANDSDVSGVAIDEITGQTSGLSTFAIAPYQPDADGTAANTFEVGIVDENTLQTLVGPVDAASNDFEYLGSSGTNASTSIGSTVATEISLTAGDITTVNGFENASEQVRFDFL